MKVATPPPWWQRKHALNVATQKLNHEAYRRFKLAPLSSGYSGMKRHHVVRQVSQ